MRGTRRADPCWGIPDVFSVMQYEDWEDAKRGIISRRRFVKLHVLADARGKKIVSCEVTKGTGARLALVQADLREGAWRRGVRDA